MIPVCRSPDVRAKTVYRSATPALVIQHFVPLITQSSPSCTARVVIEATSLPASGSLSPYAPCDVPAQIFGRYVDFIHSEPKLITGSIASLLTRNARLVEAHTRASSSAAIAWSTSDAPEPPYSSG